jgi:carbon storage regulator
LHRHIGGGSVLVLSRKVNQQIVIGQEILLTVVSIGGNQVRLGIEAPRHIPVHREEIAPSRSGRERQLPLPLDESAVQSPPAQPDAPE